MADEIRIGIELGYDTLSSGIGSKFDRKITKSAPGSSFDQTTKEYVAGVQDIGTGAHEAIALGDVATPRFAFFRNHDATNYVQVGIDQAATFHPFMRLQAGSFALVELEEAPYAQANTGAVKLEYIIFDA